MRQIPLTAALLLSLSAVPAQAQTRCQQLPNPNPNPRPGGQVGCSVALLGDSLVLGAHLDGAGSVTPCERTRGDWLCGSKLVPSDGQPGDQFGRSVGLEKDWLAVGAPFVNGSGVVYLFQKNDGGAWVERQKLSAFSVAQGAQFGLVLSLSGDTLLVGAPNSTGIAGSLSGAAYVFRLNEGIWTQSQKLTARDAAAFDNFGFSVSVDGSTAVVGAPFGEEGRADENSGAAYVFELSGGTWRERTRLTAGDGAADDQFGSAVAVSGNALAVGARGDNENRGSIYIYENGAEVARFFGEARGDRFGVAASMSGGRLLVGALLHDGNGSDSGAAYLYERRQQPDSTFRWERSGNPLRGDAAGDQFGQAVSMDGRDLLVGAYLADTGARDAGSATTCRVGNDPDPPLEPEIVLEKTNGVMRVAPGETVTYRITVSNIGKGAAPEVLVTDRFSAKLTGVSWCAPQAGQSCANPVKGNINRTISLAPGQRVVFAATGTVKPSAKGTLSNRACAQLPGEPPICAEDPPDDIEIPDLVEVDLDLDLTLTPGFIPVVAKAGQGVSFTAAITNHGPDAATEVILEVPDPLEPPVSLRPVGSSRPDACKIERTQLVCRFGRLAPGDRPITLRLDFEVTDGCAARIVNQGRVSSPNEDDVNSENDVSEAPFDLVRTASLEVEKTGPDTIEPGEDIPYTVKVTNLGPDLACGVVLSDPVPTGLVSPVVPAGCELTAGVIRCPIGELPAGQSRTFSLGFTVPEETACGSEIANAATVTGTGSDSRTATAMTTVCDGQGGDPFFDLSISKTAGAATAEPGEALSYEIVVSNLGNTTVDATVTDVFPAELTNVRWCRDVAALPPCTPGTAGDLQDTVSLAAGATATYRVAGIVAAMFTGTLSNTASVALPPELTDETPGNNSSTAETVISFSGVKVFCTDISGVNLEGETITYTFVLLNGGPAVQMDNPGDEFTDTLPAGLTLVSAGASSGVASTAGNTAAWNGSIPVGGMVTITISATIGAGTAGTAICNQASIAFDADGDGTNESNGSSDACCFPVLLASAIPALSAFGLVALALVLAVLALARLRPPLTRRR